MIRAAFIAIIQMMHVPFAREEKMLDERKHIEQRDAANPARMMILRAQSRLYSLLDCPRSSRYWRVS